MFYEGHLLIDPLVSEPLKETLQLPDVFRSRAFLNFLDKLKQCPSVKFVCVVGGMAYRGWSDKDLDLWVEIYDKNSDDSFDRLLIKYPYKFCKKDNCGYRYIGKIPVDIWIGKEIGEHNDYRKSCDLDRPFIILWSR